MNRFRIPLMAAGIVLLSYPTKGHLPSCPETISASATFASGGTLSLQTQADSLSASGTINFNNSNLPGEVNSSEVLRYGVVDDGRFVDFSSQIGSEEALIRVLVWDNGTANDQIVLQLHLSGVVILEENQIFNSDVLHLVSDCGGPGGGGTTGGTGGETTGGATNGGDGGTTGGGGDGDFVCPRTIGFWKNHHAVLEEVLNLGAIDLGDRTVQTAQEALDVLGSADASDARVMLRAQLLAASLNLQNGANPANTGDDIRSVIEDAMAFLLSHPDPVLGGHPDRAEALELKDQLDVFNNSASEGDCDDGSTGGSTGGATGGETAGGGATTGGDGGTTAGGGGGSTGGDGDLVCPRTIGFWKNHDAVLADVLADGGIDLGDRSVITAEQALDVLLSANAKDARDMLRAQLLAAALNLQNGANPWNTGTDIRQVIEDAVEFLTEHSGPVHGGHLDRAEALVLKDELDLFNNSGKDGDCDMGGDSGGSTGGTTGGTTGGDNGDDEPEDGDDGEVPEGAGGIFTIGYWKNHPEHLQVVLRNGSLNLGDSEVRTAAEASLILIKANASDMRVMLRAQLLATLLNLANGADPNASGTDIGEVVARAVEFLESHTEPVTGSHPDRDLARNLKDQLDDFNNSGAPTVEVVSSKLGSAGRLAIVWSGKAVLQEAPSLKGPWVNVSEEQLQHLANPGNSPLKFYRVSPKRD